jgi:hypothetical protein
VRNKLRLILIVTNRVQLLFTSGSQQRRRGIRLRGSGTPIDWKESEPSFSSRQLRRSGKRDKITFHYQEKNLAREVWESSSRVYEEVE